MKRRPLSTRIVSALLALVLLLSFAAPVYATEPAEAQEQLRALDYERTENISGVVDERFITDTESLDATPLDADPYEADEIVRVSVLLEEASTLDASFSTMGIADNAQAMSYRKELLTQQAIVTARIEAALDSSLDVQWNLTLAANIISANVAYGEIETIRAIAGVRDVILETRYEPYAMEEGETAQPSSVISREMIGSAAAYAEGYTGAGSRIAIIDTGLDMDHETFNAAAYEYSLSLKAAEEGLTLEEYMEKLHVLTAAEIQELLPQLHVAQRTANLTGENLYETSKVAFGYNYIDRTHLYLDHNSSTDVSGGHGSHVAGIAAANAYLANDDGSFSSALDTVFVQGVAPDAQVLVMKVFGKNGGAYDSDYMAAVEDAIILGCDSVNLSLGTTSPGFTRNDVYAELLESLTESDTVLVVAAGNTGHWADAAFHEAPGYLYAEDVSAYTAGSPGSHTNALTVASVDNDGTISSYVTVNGQNMLYTESDYGQNKMTTLAGEQEYIFIDGFGDYPEWDAIWEALSGKIAICSRGGEISFSDKAGNAVYCGAIATIIYNTEPGMINMDLTDYSMGFGFTEPAVFISQADGAAIKAASTPVTDENGNVLYYTGKLTVAEGMAPGMYNSDYYTMSAFSSWGVPGSLEMKPEITAPGGSIYSLDGTVDGGEAYVAMSGTSMAAPQVAGMAALVGQYIRENGLDTQTGLTRRALAQSLLMSTAETLEESEGVYYPVLRQGAGLADVGAAVTANSYVLMGADATDSYADGKVKVELGDDPARNGSYAFTFSLNNLNDTEQQYMLSADFFTQALTTVGEYTYMDTSTAALQANVTWTVDGEALVPAQDVSRYDFNGDSLVNGDDVQALLDYATGLRAEITNAELADLDADGDRDSYDAYLLLDTLNTGLVTLAPRGKAEIQVKVELTAEQKAALDAGFENGAYVEGYVFAKQLSTAEGVEGTCHSIPVLGFYGNWSDASMFDQGTLAERYYGTAKPAYLPVSPLADPNNLVLRPAGSGDMIYHTGNPYGIEDAYPAGKEAINPRTTLVQQTVSLIRPTASLTMLITDQDGEYLYFGDPYSQQRPAYCYNNIWFVVTGSYDLYMTPEKLGAQEGDTLNVSFLAVPEYYETDGALTTEQLKALMEQDVLGDGVYMTSSFTVDGQAPEAVAIMKDLPTGNLVVEVRDNQHVAAVQVKALSGDLLATAFPQESAEGEISRVVVDLSGVNIGEECVVVVGDYAKNETAYTVTYGGEPIDYTGKMYGYTNTPYRTTDKNHPYRWVEISPQEVWYYSQNRYDGTQNLNQMDVDITAAEYVSGYVYMAGTDGYLYIGQQGNWNSTIKLGRYDHVTTELRDMAVNYANGKLYALSGDNTIYELDFLTGELTKVASVTVTNPRAGNAQFKALTMMTIDDEGNFYLVNSGTMYTSFLYRFTLDQVVDGQITDLAPVNNTAGGTLGYYTNYGSMAWDHDNDRLYLAGGNSLRTGALSYLLEVDPETGSAWKTCDYDGGYRDPEYASKLQLIVRGLYIVPESSEDILKPSENVTSVTLHRTEINGLVGMEFTLEPEVYPWNLADKTVTWATSNEDVATVDQDGNVRLVGLGQAEITITTNAAPNLTASCAITVSELPNIRLSGLVTDAQGNAWWADIETDDPEQWTSVTAADKAYLGGGYGDGMLYLHDGTHIYGVDPDRFESTNYGNPLAAEYLWTDAAAAPYLDAPYSDAKIFGGFIGLCNDGANAIHVNPETGALWLLHPLNLQGEKLAAIAYVRSGVEDYHQYGNTIPYENCLTHWYYVLSESGILYEARFLTFDSGVNFMFALEKLGDTGLDLSGVTSQGGRRGVSMVYDQDSKHLLLTARVNDSSTKLYAISPENQYYTLLGNFGDGVYPVTSLYQYDRASSLTVELDPAETVFVGDTRQLTARVLPLDYENRVTWASSDESIATVDENGNVTALKSGTVSITATSVATDETGAHASASCTVTVKDLADSGISVNAQVVTEDGTKWASIDLSGLEVTVKANATTTFNGAGAYDGKIYGSVSDFVTTGQVYMVDPANGYAETAGMELDGYFSFVDMTVAPPRTATTEDGEEITAYGSPAFLGWWGLMGFIPDYTDYDSTIWAWLPYETFGAIAYVGDSTWTDDAWYSDEDNVTYDTAVFYLLDADGALYRYDWWPTDVDEYGLTYTYLGNIGYTFDDHTKMTMTYLNDGTWQGLLIGYGGSNGAELYYVDMSGEEMVSTKFGTIPGVTAIEGLFLDSELSAPSTLSGISAAEATQVATTAGELPAMPASRTGADQSDGRLSNTTVTPKAAAESENDCGTGKTTLTLTADGASTNGIVTVEYDATKLTLEAIDSAVDFKSIVEEAGKLTFGYVNAEAVTDLATLTFTVNTEATVTVTTVEENAAKPGTVQTLSLTAPAHDDQLIDSRAATCTEDGYNTYECAACGHTHTEILPALGHDLVSTVVAPTCEQDGYTLHECSRCDLSYRDSIVAATGHDYEAVVTEPTCTTAGYTTYTCASCGDTHKDDIVEATGHDWGEWTTTKEATCDEAGSRERVCAACGETQTEDILPTGHDYTSVVIEATCHTAGYTQWTCTCCGNTYMTDLVEALGHNFGDWTETKAPTCTEKGEETRNCARCDHSETRETDALGHDYVVETVEATCTEDGYTQHTCTVCGDSYLTDLVEALGHDYAAEIVEPTCTEDGYTQYTCTLCGDSYLTDYVKAHCPSKAFTDLDVTEWYHEGVDYVLEKGLMKGMSDTEFQPKGNLTRAQLVTTLYRMAGEPSVEGMENPFTDVNENDWFAAAVIWAYDAKIVNGTSDTTFAPNAAITREQIAAILYRYSGAEPVEEDHLKDFTDAAEVTAYAEDALNWAVAEGLITGMGNGKVAPKATATRAQIATILMRYCEK